MLISHKCLFLPQFMIFTWSDSPIMVQFYYSEYYFSIDNLLHDMFLRKQMDSEGWISLEIISKFHRIQALGGNLQLIIQVSGVIILIIIDRKKYTT